MKESCQVHLDIFFQGPAELEICIHFQVKHEMQKSIRFRFRSTPVLGGQDQVQVNIRLRFSLDLCQYDQSKMSNKRKVFDSCVLSVLTYIAKTLPLTKAFEVSLRVTRRAVEHSMLGISFREKSVKPMDSSTYKSHWCNGNGKNSIS